MNQQDQTLAIQHKVGTYIRTYGPNGEYREEVRVHADIELKSLHGQPPYFAITGHTERRREREHPTTGTLFFGGRWAEGSWGMIHDDIRAAHPDIPKYFRWHLFGANGPTHYEANAVFWLQKAHEGGDKSPYSRNDTPEKCLEAFYRIIVFGALSNEQTESRRDAQTWAEWLLDLDNFEEVKDWLRLRLPYVKDVFWAEIQELFGDYTLRYRAEHIAYQWQLRVNARAGGPEYAMTPQRD